MLKLSIDISETIRSSMNVLMKSLEYKDLNERIEYKITSIDEVIECYNARYFVETKDEIGRIVEETQEFYLDFSCSLPFEYILKQMAQLFCALSMVKWGAKQQGGNYVPQRMRPFCKEETLLGVIYEALYPGCRPLVYDEFVDTYGLEPGYYPVLLYTDEEQHRLLEVTIAIARAMQKHYEEMGSMDYDECGQLFIETLSNHAEKLDEEAERMPGDLYRDALLYIIRHEKEQAEQQPIVQPRKKGRPAAKPVYQTFAVYDQLKNELDGKLPQQQKRILRQYVERGILTEMPLYPALAKAGLVTCSKDVWYDTQ